MNNPNGITHKPGCPAFGGYGHKVEECICGADAVVTTTPNWQAAQRALVAYVEDYEMEGDGGFYIPTDSDKCMLIDCINGLLVDEDFIKALSLSSKSCLWVQDSDGTWQTNCGVSWEFTDEGLPKDNGMNFCHNCGKPLIADAYNEDDNDA